MICQVIVDIAHSEVDKIFDYCDGGLEVSCGSRVVVPFGSLKIEGVVIGISEKSAFPLNKIKNIVRVIDESPAITQEHLKLMEFMKAKYHIPFASILRLFLPSEMRKGRVREKTAIFLSFALDSLDEAIALIGKRAVKQIELCKFMFERKKIKGSVVNNEFGSSAVKGLIEKGILIASEDRIRRAPYVGLERVNKEFVLTADQNKVVSSITATEKQITLIHGVTGSGKTRVYLKLIKDAVESGKGAILLVPEISLTPQMLGQLRASFGETCAILHSGLSAGEKFDEWWRLRSGEAKIAVGARSAIFAPIENLGVIIIDEEHDGSYESESSPRYSTIDVAKFRAEFNGCKLILGSATPSIESYLSAKEGKYNLTEMKKRINEKPLPEVIIADMRNEVRRGNNSIFSSVLKAEIENCLNEGNQAIIFMNRRGYSQQVICRECGFVAKCDSCDVSLNYHSQGNLLKCHYCGATYKMITNCPQCGGVSLNYMGIGTQKIVEELKKLFPKANVLRMDNDTTQNKDAHFEILKKFADKKGDILVGTQMVAKGHDFPSVTLVGILDADMSLFFSDFRSGERTFQLLTQVAGRCGRAEKSGTVVLQTYAPNNPVLKFATTYDYESFFTREVALRKATSFPPYSVILRVMVESEVDQTALETLKDVYFEVKEIYDKNQDEFLFFNKMKSPIKRMKDKFRYQILMRLKPQAKCVDQIYEASIKHTTNKVLVYVEKNPSSLS